MSVIDDINALLPDNRTGQITPAKLREAVGKAAGWESDASTALVLASGSTTPRSLAQRAGDVVSVKDFGARGDGVTDDRAAIQAAIDAAAIKTGTVIYPHGDYYVASPLVPRDGVRHVGTYGWGPYEDNPGSRLTAPSGGVIFQYASLSDSDFEGLAFLAPNGYAFKQTDLGKYTANCLWDRNVFWANCAEGIYGNLILCDIQNSSFGVNGNPSASSRHIYSKGVLAGNATNINRVTNNLFWQSTAAEAIYVESGWNWEFSGNDFEGNANTGRPIRIRGGGNVTFVNNWFERNAGTHLISLEVDPTGTAGTDAIFVANMFGSPEPEATHLVDLQGACETSWLNNSTILYTSAQYVTRRFGSVWNDGIAAWTANTKLQCNQSGITVSIAGTLSVTALTAGTRTWEQISGDTEPTASALELISLLHSSSNNIFSPYAYNGRYYIAARQNNSAGEGRLKFPSGGWTHMDCSFTFSNAIDAATRTWTLDYSVDGGSTWTGAVTITGGAGDSSGTITIPAGASGATMIRWRQTGGWNANSATILVGLKSLTVAPRIQNTAILPVTA